MDNPLLPDGLDHLIQRAVQIFWETRSGGSSSQAGGRGNVIGGKNLDGFLDVVREVAVHCGLDRDEVYLRGKKDLTLPGFYRPLKNWDVVVVRGCRLVAVLELKSQVGSFGNNFNNRSEEVLGNATDLLEAFRQGAFRPARHIACDGVTLPDPRPPFLGYLMLLQDCEKVLQPVRGDSNHFPMLAEFEGSSYAERYRLLCEKMMQQGLYSAASLLLSPQGERGMEGDWRSLSDATDPLNLFAQLAAQFRAATLY